MSLWWPVPANPSTWFSDFELAESRRYFRPLGRVAALRNLARVSGLVLAWVISINGMDQSSSWVLRWFVGSLLVSAAWWVPATLSDWWFDRKHEPTFGIPALPVKQLVVGSFVSGLATLMATMVGGGLILVTAALVFASRPGWWAVLGVGLGLTTLGVGFVLLRERFSAVGHSLSPLPPGQVEPLVVLGRQLGVDEVSFWLVDSGWLMDSAREAGCNALTMGGFLGSRPKVGLTPELVSASDELRLLVVAHELGHIRFRHIRRSALVGFVGLLLGAFVLSFVLSLEVLWREADEPGDPRSLAGVAGLVWIISAVVGLVLAWFGRAYERQADRLAFRAVAPASALAIVSQLHHGPRANRDPGLISRLLSSHPPVAERLQRAKVVTESVPQPFT